MTTSAQFATAVEALKSIGLRVERWDRLSDDQRHKTIIVLTEVMGRLLVAPLTAFGDNSRDETVDIVPEAGKDRVPVGYADAYGIFWPEALAPGQLKLRMEEGSEVLRGMSFSGAKPGDLVSVRPVDDKFEGKTFLGVYVGEQARGLSYEATPTEDGIVAARYSYYNPLILIPDEGVTVMGYESWWRVIRKEEDLRRITDEDIQNVWYVRAIKQIEQAKLKRDGLKDHEQ